MPARRQDQRKEAADNRLCPRERYQITMFNEDTAEYIATEERHWNQHRIGDMETGKDECGAPGGRIRSFENGQQTVREKRLQTELLKKAERKIPAQTCQFA